MAKNSVTALLKQFRIITVVERDRYKVKIVHTNIPEIKLIQINEHPDEREMKTNCIVTYQWNILRQYIDQEAKPFISEAESFIKRTGTVRGLYYDRPPKTGSLLIRCVSGSAFQVAVDLRDNMPTYRKWVGKILSAENGLQMYVPSGFAQGFLTLEDNTVLQYKSTSYVLPQFRKLIHYADPLIGISWPQEPIYMSAQVKFANGIEQVELETEMECLDNASEYDERELEIEQMAGRENG